MGNTKESSGMVAVGTRRNGDGTYTGVIRRGGAVVLDCGHSHRNRDLSYRSSGISARDCVNDLVRASRQPAFRDHEAEKIATAWRRLGRGFAVGSSTIAAARAEAPAEVAAYLATIERVAALIAA